MIKSPQQAFESLKKYLRTTCTSNEGKQGMLEKTKNHIVFERAISRIALAVQQQDKRQWALKGGMLMNIRYPDQSRATKDIDLTYWNVESCNTYQDVKKMLQRDMMQTEHDQDMFKFIIQDAKGAKLTSNETGTATASFLVSAFLGKNKVTSFGVDIGIADKPVAVDNMSYKSDYASFMDYAHAEFPAISIEQHFAEKIHAYSKPISHYTNMRFKDLYDMSMIIKQGDIDPDKIKVAIDHVFELRGTHDVVNALLPPPESWKDLFQEMSSTYGNGENMYEAFETLQDFCADHEIIKDPMDVTRKSYYSRGEPGMLSDCIAYASNLA